MLIEINLQESIQMVRKQPHTATLEEAIRDMDVAEALAYVGELFVFGSDQLSRDQISAFDAIFTRLVGDADRATRAALADRLAPIRNAPEKIIRLLAFDEAIEVSAPVLTRSEQLEREALIAIARTKGREQLLALTRRASLDETLTGILIDCGIEDVVRSTVRNPGAIFSGSDYARLVERAKSDEVLALSLATRIDLPQPLALELQASVSAVVRGAFEAKSASRLAFLSSDLAPATQPAKSNFPDSQRDHFISRPFIVASYAAGRLGELDLEEFARMNWRWETAIALSLMAGLKTETVLAAMHQERPEVILIIARAAGLTWRTAKAILLLCTRERPLSPLKLEQSLASFTRLKPETAKRVVQFYRARE